MKQPCLFTAQLLKDIMQMLHKNFAFQTEPAPVFLPLPPTPHSKKGENKACLGLCVLRVHEDRGPGQDGLYLISD